MLEFLYNYENKDSNNYPCLEIDWITSIEIEYLQKKYSNYDSSVNELSEVNLNGTSELDDWFSDSSVEETESNSDEDDIDDLFGDELFEDGDVKEDISLDELMSIVDSDYEETKDNKKQSLFNDKVLPLFVGDEKIIEAKLNAELLGNLNHFFKRKWVLRLSEDESMDIDDKFIIENVLKL